MLVSEAPKNPLTASQMFALYPGNYFCTGPDECHWCSCPCQRSVPHDDEGIPVIGRRTSLAKRPANQFICLGCQIYRRKRTTITYLDETFKDGKCLMNYSWWIDKEGPRVIDPEHWTKKVIDPRTGEAIYKNIFKEKLLSPPNSFCLSMITEGGTNHVQLALANDFCVIKAETPLKFTVDRRPYTYSVFELKKAFENGAKGLEPGTQLLLEMLGGPNEKVKRPHGRPKGQDWEKSPKQQVAASGNPSLPIPS